MLKRLYFSLRGVYGSPAWYLAVGGILLVSALALAPRISGRFFDSTGFEPHGHCFLWRGDLLYMLVTSDMVIGLSYMAISLTLIYFVRQARQEIPFHGMFIAFGMFIFACGITHFVDIWLLWQPDYWLSGTVKAVTAIASVVTAILLPPLVPRALSIISEAKVSRQRKTQLEQLNTELTNAKEAADIASNAKSDFLASMSHELRTPLNGILGYTQILRREKPLTEHLREGLDIISRSGEHLLALINDILDLSKIEAQHMELLPANFSLPDMLQTLIDMFTLRAQQKGIAFSYETITELPDGVYGDEKRLRQVLINLLGNAIKFTEKGGVIFKVGYNNGKMRFQIEDTGIGIAPAAMEDIFQPFRQAGRSEGTGLGLTISRRLVAMMGGTIQVFSTLKAGSTFFFEIDLPAVQGFSEIIQETEGQVAGYTGARRSILVADDKWENRTVLRRMLEPLGFLLVEAVDGQQALDQAINLKPDAVLLDLRMPVMDGFEVVRRLRALQTMQTTTVIAVSASAFEHNRQESLAAGCDDFLIKPFRLPKLLDLLQQHLHLTWIYEGEDDPAPLPLATAEWKVPPAADLARLADLAQRGNLRAIQKEADVLTQQGYERFATEINTLASGFKVRELREFIQQHREA